MHFNSRHNGLCQESIEYFSFKSTLVFFFWIFRRQKIVVSLQSRKVGGESEEGLDWLFQILVENLLSFSSPSGSSIWQFDTMSFIWVPRLPSQKRSVVVFRMATVDMILFEVGALKLEEDKLATPLYFPINVIVTTHFQANYILPLNLKTVCAY